MNDRLNYTEAELDSKLNSPAQLEIAQMVNALPEETLSLTWRSQLNERIRTSAPAKRASRVWQILVPATALGCCAMLAFTIFLSKNASPGPSTASRSVEADLLSAYREHSSMRDVGGYGLYIDETYNVTKDEPSEDYSDDDLGTL